MMFIKVLLQIFLSGGIFLYTIYRLFGIRFKLSFFKVISAVGMSIFLNAITRGVNYGYIGLSEHIWFDCVSIIFAAVFLAVIVSLGLLLLPKRVLKKIFIKKKVHNIKQEKVKFLNAA